MGLPRWYNGKESACNARASSVASLILILEKSPGEGNGFGFPGGTSGKEPAWQCRSCKNCGFYPGRFPLGGHGNPLYYSFLEFSSV